MELKIVSDSQAGKEGLIDMKQEEDFIQNRFGYCFYSIGKSCVVYNLYIHPKYRKQGRARKLLTFVINEIRESGYNGDIGIEVSPRGKSINLTSLTVFYKDMGLKIISNKGKL